MEPTPVTTPTDRDQRLIDVNAGRAVEKDTLKARRKARRRVRASRRANR